MKILRGAYKVSPVSEKSVARKTLHVKRTSMFVALNFCFIGLGLTPALAVDDELSILSQLVGQALRQLLPQEIN